ncbi:VWA domain-containing protein [Bacillaceae bacterium SIJ1]|uniref:VWA domain-containing protein n=1 Tax=Litoribacterium kuwaitense TaxID=1398745 RepID=UPI0013EB21D6|nr:VWA domain-containing protein [Litoribacterium kuwaitense]NGP44270.1 VWA domain-containing protein [Litoribacterium kuwaitense]
MAFDVNHLWVLLLLVPCTILLAHWGKSLGGRQASLEHRIAMIIRPVVYVLLILALAGSSVLWPISHKNVIFVADTSASMAQTKEAIQEHIAQAVEHKQPEDRFGIVTTALNAVIERSAQTLPSFGTDWSDMTGTATNLAEGIQLASSLLAEEGGGRIVVMTDGQENIGTASQQAALANKQNITTDVWAYEPTQGKDAMIQSLNSPAYAFQGEMMPLDLSIVSNVNAEARLLIYKNSTIIVDDTVSLQEGSTELTYSTKAEEAGSALFRAEIALPEDSMPENNESYAVTEVDGPPRILVVEGEKGEASNVTQALASSGIRVDVRSVSGLPKELNALLAFDALIFANVSATDVSEQQMTLIQTAVQDTGMGFLMTGGDESFGLGGYFDTPIEDLLPVKMELTGKKEIPSLGIVFVIDRSGSMAGMKLQLAKEAAVRSIEMLREKDQLGVIAFDEQPHTVLDLAPLSNKEKAVDDVLSMTQGGGTDIFPAVREAYEQLLPLNVKRKHIVLLTDGHSSGGGSYSALLAEGAQENITLSSVAIGSGADASLLQRLADEGSGRFYNVQDISTIPSILSRETAMTSRTYIVDDPFFPAPHQVEPLGQWFQQGVPEMNAYIATTLKNRSSLLLESNREDPVLATWTYGLGRTAAWTSDVTGEWSGAWPGWSSWASMWNGLATWLLPSQTKEPFYTEVYRDEGDVLVELTAESFEARALSSEIVTASGESVASSFSVTGPGTYETRFAGEAGLYYVLLYEGDGEERRLVYRKGFAAPYSNEYQWAKTDQTVTHDIIRSGEGQRIKNASDSFRPLANPPVQRTELAPWLVLLAFLLFFAEIAVRRLGWPSFLTIKRQDRTDRNEPSPNESRSPFSNKVKENKPTGKQKPAVPTDKPPQKAALGENKKTGASSSNDVDRMKRLLDAKKRRSR